MSPNELVSWALAITVATCAAVAVAIPLAIAVHQIIQMFKE